MSIEIKRRVHARAQEQISAKIVELETGLEAARKQAKAESGSKGKYQAKDVGGGKPKGAKGRGKGKNQSKGPPWDCPHEACAA